MLLEALQSSPVDAKQIKARDPILARVQELVKYGWTRADSDSELASFQDRKDELSVLDGCVLWGCRVVIPSRGRAKVLEVLHKGHPGIKVWPGVLCGGQD